MNHSKHRIFLITGLVSCLLFLLFSVVSAADEQAGFLTKSGNTLGSTIPTGKTVAITLLPNNTFNPQEISIEPGDTVEWIRDASGTNLYNVVFVDQGQTIRLGENANGDRGNTWTKKSHTFADTGEPYRAIDFYSEGFGTPGNLTTMAGRIYVEYTSTKMKSENDNLTVNVGKGESVSFACVTSSIKINGAEPTPAIGCVALKSIVVFGGSGNNEIDLSRIAIVDFPGLQTINVNGGLGSDVITGTQFSDVIDGGGGDDRFLNGGRGGSDTIRGGAGRDRIVASNADILATAPGGNNDSIDGGEGIDEFKITGAAINPSKPNDPVNDVIEVTVAAQRSADAGVLLKRTSLVPYSMNVQIEELIINGSDGNDSIIVAPGVSSVISITTIQGDDNDDTLAGANVMDGGNGTDTVFVTGDDQADEFAYSGVDPASSKILVTRTVSSSVHQITAEFLQFDLAGGNDKVTGGLYLRNHISTTMNGGGGDDLLTGGDGFDVIRGEEGNDSITGGRNKDVINGGLGDDTVIWNPGDGSDESSGDDGVDTAQINGEPGSDIFTTETSKVTGRVSVERGEPGVTNTQTVAISVTFESLSINGIEGNDFFNIEPNPSVLINVNGGAGSDTLTVLPKGKTVTNRTETSITVEGNKDVIHGEVESVVVGGSFAVYLPVVNKP